MKRPLQPVSEYEGHESYPSHEQAGLSRRGFLRTAATATAFAAVGATTLGGEAGAAPASASGPGSGSKDKRQRVTIQLDRYTQIGRSGLRAQKLDIFTDNKDLARFLRKHSEQRRVRTALMKRLRKVKPKTLYDGRKIYRLERSLGAIVAEQYRKRRGKRARQPDVMLTITRYYGYMKLGGAMVRPSLRRHP